MKILHRYILSQLLRNLLLSLMVVVFLFLVFDFFDRIDNILAENSTFLLAIEYFLLKVPLMVGLMLPVAYMTSVLLTIGMLSKNSEITAMRAAGVPVRWIAVPALLLGFILSLVSLLLNEAIVPYSQRKASEIYNIDIKQKDKRGGYSQSNIWWRVKDTFYSVDSFDSSSNTLQHLSLFKLNEAFETYKRTDATSASWIDPVLGWNMENVKEYRFSRDGDLDSKHFPKLPLPIAENPVDFYQVQTDPHTMTYMELKDFIKRQKRNGLDVGGYYAFLYEKLSSPLICLIVALIVLPFALRPARSGSMAASIIAALVIGFSYYAVHSFSIAMGRAEIIHPLLAAWTANILMGFIGLVLLAGAESN